jgi:hypothetical protein
MEGYFWRITHPASGVVAIALCGVNQSPSGPWATVAVAAHPAGVVRSAAVPTAADDPRRLDVTAGVALRADEGAVRAELDDVVLDARLEPETWPLALPGGGLAGVVPFLGQYWHPHVLRAPVTGTLRVGDRTWDLDGGVAYAEKNWGRGFPERWWWGQANGFERPDLSVAFGGGRLSGGPLATDVTGIVCAVDDRIVRMAPPFARVSCEVGDGTWDVRGRWRGTEVVIHGEAAGSEPAVLPVPLPAERRNVDTDFEHLAATMHVTIRDRGRLVAEGTSRLAGRRDPPDLSA